ncbi:MAG: FAD-dependent oxidoreductase [Spirochaetota bacterium]
MKSSKRTAEKKITTAGEYDIIVVGGGPAGVSAAFAASRRGMKTLIVEQFNCLGGIATAGGHGHICLYSSSGTGERVVGGVIHEISKRTADAGYGVVNNSSSDFEIEGMKCTLEKIAEETKTDVLYYTQFADAVVEKGAVTGVIVQNKSGRSAYRAKRIIDCTGDGDVAARAGCGFDMGDEETGHCQPVTLMFTIGGVDHEKVKAFRGGDYKLQRVWEEAQKNGDMRPFQNVIMGWWWTPTRPDQIGVNFTHINFIDSTKAEDLTKATIEGRKQAYESIAVYRKYIPGMEHCYMVSTPNTVGARESRRIHGLNTLTREHVVTQATFDDSIGYGSFFIDIHGTTGPGMDAKVWNPPKGFKYQIPYGIIVPKDVDNLFVAGRCASATHEALGSLRVMPQCGVMGEAAGTAAVLSIEKNIAPKNIDVRALQGMLREQKCIVDESDIARYA